MNTMMNLLAFFSALLLIGMTFHYVIPLFDGEPFALAGKMVVYITGGLCIRYLWTRLKNQR